MKTVLYVLLSAIAAVVLLKLTIWDGHFHYRHYQESVESVVLPPAPTIVETRQVVSCSPEFGYQPSSPTPCAVIVPWEETVFRNRSPMDVEVNGVTMLKPVPIGMLVYKDPNDRWYWTTDGNRVKLSNRKIPDGEWIQKTGQMPQQPQPQQFQQPQQLQQHIQPRPQVLHIQPYPPTTMRRYPR